jgi:hypothetical protein
LIGTPSFSRRLPWVWRRSWKRIGRDVGVVDEAPEGFVHGVGVHGFAVAVGEHPLLGVVHADRGGLGGLVGPPPFEGR